MHHTELLYQLKQQKIQLWAKPDGNLGFSVGQQDGFPADLKARVAAAKADLLDILRFNDIGSEAQARATEFYRLPEAFQPRVLSNIQQGIYLQARLDSLPYSYNVPVFIEVDDMPAAQAARAVRALLARQDMLRLKIGADMACGCFDVEEFTVAEVEIDAGQVEAECALRYQRPFQLDGGKLVQTEILTVRGSGRIIINLTHHHILSDALSVGILMAEALRAEAGPAAPAAPVTYRDFQAWQAYLLGTEQYQQGLARLAARLDGAEALPAAAKRRAVGTNQAGLMRRRIGTQRYHALRTAALDQGVSLYALLLTGLYHTLSVFNGGQQNFPLGLTISNRPFALAGTVGPFISTLPLIPAYQPSATMAANVKLVNEELNYLNEHQQLNLNLVAARLPQRAGDMAQLMHVMFTMHNFGGLDTSGAAYRHRLINVPEEVEKFGLSVTATELDDSIELQVSYALDLYGAPYVSALFDSYLALLDGIDAASWQEPIASLPLLAPGHAAPPQPVHAVREALDSVFELQAARTPDAVAVVCGATTLSYRQLNEQANRLAHYMKEHHGVARETPVALWLEGTADVIVAMLAVLKAGGCYVPLSSSFPPDKVQYILGQTAPRLVLTHAALREGAGGVATLVLDDAATAAAIAACPADNLALGLPPTNLAYIMYTSGTTNNPKGVMVEHAGIVSLACDPGYIDVTPADALLLLCDQGFDVATFEIWAALLNGARVVVPEDKLALLSDVERFAALLEAQRISVLWLTKTLFDQIYVADEQVFAGLRCLLIGGEALNKPLIDKLAASDYRPAHLINGYGPTENTTFSCTLEIDSANLALADSVLIGKPMRDRSAFVLDAAGRQLPDYAIGELYVGGAGVARGYLHNPELTRSQFVPNPFQTAQEKAEGVHHTLYRTGDLVRRHASGDLEFLGRRDTQVKLRGYRIELPEIEEVLMAFPGVVQAAVIVSKVAGADHLLAYYVADRELQESEVKAHVARMLPSYMVPSRCIALDALPANQNGKLDKKRLPLPALLDGQDYVAPRNDLERTLCAIFAAQFELDAAKVGCRDDFFAMGGNSVLAISVASKINQTLKASVTARTIYECKTVEGIAAVLAAGRQEFVYEAFLIDAAQGKADQFEPFPLTNVQQAYQLGRSSSFGLGNVATHIYQEHAFTMLDVGRLEASFNALIARHPALRTVFSDSSQRILQTTPYYRIAVQDFTSAGSLEAYRDAMSHKIYDLTVFPLFDVAVSHTLSGIILHLSFDALLMDAHSFRIFFDEWTLLYNEPDAVLPPLELSYRDYVCRFDEVRAGPQFAQARAYWENKLDDYNFDVGLPTVANAQQIAKPVFKRATRTIPQAVWRRLESRAQRAGISPTVAMLALYGEVLCFWTGQPNVCINLTLFNRLPLHPQVNDIVGDFTVLELFNYVAARGEERRLAPLMAAVHQALWEDIDHNLFDGIDFQRLVRSRKAIPSGQPLAPVVFTSLVGNTGKFQKTGIFINDSYQRETYSITQTSQVWLDNKAYENQDGLVVEWDYVEQLFDAALVETMHAAYCGMIEALADCDWQDAVLPRLPLPEADRQVIAQANAAVQATSTGTLFSRCAGRDDAIAVIEGGSGRQFSHAQLRADSAQLARHLVRSEGTDGGLIAILSEKGYNQVAASLAIMQSGHGYLPLHVEWPAGRIDTVLQQGKVRTVLLSAKQAACEEIQAALAGRYRLLVIETLLEQLAGDASLHAQALPQVAPDDLAYVIFTSGSTGVPKGVSISHRGALNTIDAVNQRFSV
ncbi:non-ribosomal peptide synthetase, partial [Pseudoduganella ginsengisoli]